MLGSFLFPLRHFLFDHAGIYAVAAGFEAFSTHGSLSFGNVAQPGLDEDFLLGDLTVIGSLQGGGGLGEVDLVYVPVPEPSALMLAVLGLLGLVAASRRQ